MRPPIRGPTRAGVIGGGRLRYQRRIRERGCLPTRLRDPNGRPGRSRRPRSVVLLRRGLVMPDVTPPASLSAIGLSKSFSGTTALSGVDLTIQPGTIHALLGENGSGKSTLIKILTGFHTPDAGEAYVAGSHLSFGSAESSYRLGCRVVHQDLGLVDSSSILDNLSFTAG